MSSEVELGAPERLPLPHRRAPQVELRPLRLDDAPRLRRWLTDMELLRLTILVPGPSFEPVAPFSLAAADEYLRRMVEAPDRRVYAIEQNGVHVGNVGLKAVHPNARQAECFIEIGEPTSRGRGVGRMAMEQLLMLAFGPMALQRVHLGVFPFNAPALALYRGLGFTPAPRYGWHYVAGQFCEVLGMELWRGGPTVR